MRNIIMYKDGEQSFVTWIKKRIDHNLNFLAIFEGPTGAGKSYSALSIASAIDPEFNPTEQVAFSFRELMRIINKFNNVENDSGDVKPTPLYKRKYKVILFDEAQTDLSNRDWQSKVNKLFNYLLSTFRHQNIILLFTSPYSDFIDSASMKLLHAKFEVRGWNKKTEKAHIRPKLLQYNSKMKKFYEHSLHVIRNGTTNKLVNWFISKPSAHISIPYEQMKSAFTGELNRQITEELEAMGKEESDSSVDLRKTLDPNSMQYIIWDIVKQEGYVTQQELADKLAKHKGRVVMQSEVARNVMSMRKKGYDIRIYKRK